MKKLTIAMTTLLLVTLLATTAFAWGRGWGRGPGAAYCNGPEDRAFSQLNLTAEQTAKIKALREVHLKDVTPLREKVFSKRNELRILWLKDNPDEAKILAVQKEMRALRDQLADKRTSHRLAAFKVLTPEQQQKMQAFRSGSGKGRGAGFGWSPRGGAGPGPGFGRGNW
ncbi:MAG: Spy/CpxP family protein refolding chaperone [Syntrophales bacterium]|jgi:zinc resistance-associated protein|nr:Spy/CpxP family protein refolding chaperone [Syntrophales bacterium]MDD4339079.1 Spy/CpxP family protein refolding chaperone [Syntrophales bacterium]HOG07771.1 Spy/CpxP family protein refolding chaperone [Syntrophales bacterium]HOS77613.1 Spy/CpxP family protein refolding chaperone [Syntrophales bacterium]